MVQGCNNNYITTIIGRRGRCSHMQQQHHHVYNNNSHLHHFGGGAEQFFFVSLLKVQFFKLTKLIIWVFFTRGHVFFTKGQGLE